MARAGSQWGAVGSLAHAGSFARVRLPLPPPARRVAYDDFLRHHGNSFRLDATGNRKHLAGRNWPWRAERGGRIWLRFCRCESEDRYGLRHNCGLEWVDPARVDHRTVGNPETLARP